jgi:hypothetical protein
VKPQRISAPCESNSGELWGVGFEEGILEGQEWGALGGMNGIGVLRTLRGSDLTEHEGDWDEAGVLIAVNDEFLEVAFLLFSQHEAAG